MDKEAIRNYSFDTVLNVAIRGKLSNLKGPNREKRYTTLHRLYKLHDKWVENLADIKAD